MKSVLLGFSILFTTILSGCGGGGGSSGGGNNIIPSPSNTVNVPALSVNDSSTVPVVNGASSSGVLYIHNYSNSDISGINISLQTVSATSSLQKKIKSGRTRANIIEDSNGFTLVNPTECSVIKAGSSCGLQFTTPTLVAGDQNSAVVNLNYTDTSHNNRATSIYTIVNYKYIDTTQFSGLQFFDDGVTAIMESRPNQYTTSYLISGGTPGTIHDDVALNIDKSGNVAIASGFNNKTQISAGLAIPIEFLTILNGSEEVDALVTPSCSMDNTKHSLISKQNKNKVVLRNNTPVQIRIKASGSHIHVGSLPIINLAENHSQTVAVVNDGSDNVAAGAFTITSDNSGITIDNGCSSGIQNHASQICLVTFSFSKDMSGSGSAQIGYQVDGKTIVQNTLNYTAELSPNESAPNEQVPNLIIRANPSNIYGGINSTSTPIIYTLYYDGNVRYQGVNIVSNITGSGLTAFNVTGGSCGISSLNGTHELPSGSTCTIEGQYQTSSTAGSGSASLKFNFTYAGKNFNFDSDIITYTVTAAPDLTFTDPNAISEIPRIVIFPQTDDDLSESGDYIFTIKNTGVSSAILNGYNLDVGTSNNKTVPLIDNYTLNNACTQNQTLAVGESCVIRISYGPLTSAERAYSESGIATLHINYHGETSNNPQTLSLPLNYQHIGTDDVHVGVEFTGYNIGSGDGLTANTAFVTDGHNNDRQGVRFVYTNHSQYYYLQNFSVTLPKYFSVDNANTTCGYSGAPHELAPLESCIYTIFVDKSALSSKLENTGDLEYLFEGQKISLPTAVYAVSFSQNSDHYDTDYKARPVEAAYDGFFLKYSQPLITYSVSGQNNPTATISLGLSGNYNNYSPISITYSVNNYAYNWVLPLQTNSSNCTQNNDYSVSCILWDGNTYTPADISLSLDPDYLFNDPYSVSSMIEVNSTGAISVPNSGYIDLILQNP